jgi:STE24 endopeptidase
MDAILDLEKQKKAKQYARIKRRLWLVSTLISGIYAMLWLIIGWAVALRDRLMLLTDNDWLLVFGFVAVFGGIVYLIDLPLNYYSSFVLPHRFNQSNQLLKDWIADQLKGLIIGIPLGILLLELLYLALRVAGDFWWLWATGGILFFSIILGNLAPILIMPLFNKYVPLGEDHADLAERLLKLAEKAKTKVKGVYKFDMSRRTNAANAALTGIGNTRRIILGDTLIDNFNFDEIEVVLAHELGHHVNNDIPILMLYSTFLSAIGLYLVSLAMKWAEGYFGFSSVADVAAFPALLLALGIYNLLTMPLENGFSRWRERMADTYALKSTGKGDAFVSAFVRLANQNLGEVEPEKWVVFMFYSHPPLGERIVKAKNWVQGNQQVSSL